MTPLTLPAITLPDTEITTAAGVLRMPGQQIPERTIHIDPQQIQRLLLAARDAATKAYAPYSRFRVGAAMIMADDPHEQIFCGANIENSSYGVACCAERSGLFSGTAQGFRQLKLLAVSTLDALHQPLAERSPCGVCRQAIKEFVARDVGTDQALILIDSADPDTLCEVFDIDRLLPFGFNFSGPS